MDDDGFPICVPIETVHSLNKFQFKLPNGVSIQIMDKVNIQVRDDNTQELYFKLTHLEGRIDDKQSGKQSIFICQKETHEVIDTQNNLISQLISSLPDGKKPIDEFNQRLLHDILKMENSGLLIVNIANNLHIHRITCNPNSNGLEFEIEDSNNLNSIMEYVAEGTIVFDKMNKSLDNVSLTGSIEFGQQVNTSQIYSFKPRSMNYGNQSTSENVQMQKQSLFPFSKFGRKTIMKARYWYNLTRFPLLLFSLVPLLIGSVLADPHQNGVKLDLLLLAVVAVLFFQTAANLLNDYFDHKSDSDEYAVVHTKLNAGSRFLQLRLIDEDQIKNISVISIISGIAVGLYINSLIEGYDILLFGIVGGLIILSYNLPPTKLSYRWYGDIVFAFSIFPLILIGSSFVQDQQRIDLLAISLIGISMACLVLAILFVGNIMSYDAEKAASKTTFTVKFGKQQTVNAIVIFLITHYLIELLLMLALGEDLIVLIIIISIGIAFKGYDMFYQNFDNILALERGYRLLVYAFLVNYIPMIIILYL